VGTAVNPCTLRCPGICQLLLDLVQVVGLHARNRQQGKRLSVLTKCHPDELIIINARAQNVLNSTKPTRLASPPPSLPSGKRSKRPSSQRSRRKVSRPSDLPSSVAAREAWRAFPRASWSDRVVGPFVAVWPQIRPSFLAHSFFRFENGHFVYKQTLECHPTQHLPTLCIASCCQSNLYA
jgi:hypothetical protein